MKIKKNDIVKILAGKDRGKTGHIIRVLHKKNKVVVEGLNLSLKHSKPRREAEKGQRIKIAMPLDISNINLICPKCKKAIRVGYKILANKTKKRFCRKCKNIFD